MDASTLKSSLSTITPCLGNQQREVIVDVLFKPMDRTSITVVGGLEFRLEGRLEVFSLPRHQQRAHNAEAHATGEDKQTNHKLSLGPELEPPHTFSI